MKFTNSDETNEGLKQKFLKEHQNNIDNIIYIGPIQTHVMQLQRMMDFAMRSHGNSLTQTSMLEH